MSDAENQNSLPPASPAEGAAEASPSAAPPPPGMPPAFRPSVDDPELLAAATGRKPRRAPRSGDFKPGNPYHRPTIMTAEVVKQVLVGVRTKYTIIGAAAFAGIGKRTLHRWKRDCEELAELIELAQSGQVERLISQMLKIAQGGKDGKRTGSDWRAIAWLLERSPAARGQLYKFNPDVVTPDKLASTAAEIAAKLLPLIPAELQTQASAAMEGIYGSLKPKGDGEGDDGS